MKERIKRFAAALLAACVLAACLPVQMMTAYAATARIAFSDPSAEVGADVKVNMKITSADGTLSTADVMLSYDSDLLEFVEGTDADGGAGAVRVHGDAGTPNTAQLAYVLTFKTKKAGNAKITVTNQEIYDADSKLVTVSQEGSSAVTIGAQATASKDASLKSLQISPGTLSPEFSAGVDTYAVTVGTDVEQLVVSAETTDSKATVSVSGADALQMGENRVICKVTAADGETTKEYVIVVTKAEGGASADETTEAASDHAGESTGVKLTTLSRSITILEPDPAVTLPEGFVETAIKIDGHTVTGWIWPGDTDNEYCVVYGMNEAGEKNFYRYDMTENEKTIQRYFQDPASDAGMTDKYNELAQQYNDLVKIANTRRIVMFVMIGLCVVLVVLLLAVGVFGGNSKNKNGSRPQKRNSKDPEEDLEDEEDDEEEDEQDPFEKEEKPVKPIVTRLPRTEAQAQSAATTVREPEMEQTRVMPELTKVQRPAPVSEPEPDEELDVVDLEDEDMTPEPKPTKEPDEDDLEMIDLD